MSQGDKKKDLGASDINPLAGDLLDELAAAEATPQAGMNMGMDIDATMPLAPLSPLEPAADPLAQPEQSPQAPLEVAAKKGKKEKEKKKKEPKPRKEKPVSADKGPGALAKLAAASPYTVMLAVAVTALVIGMLCLLLEWQRYNWDAKAKDTQQSARIAAPMTPDSSAGHLRAV